jgi:hypothetical protein
MRGRAQLHFAGYAPADACTKTFVRRGHATEDALDDHPTWCNNTAALYVLGRVRCTIDCGSWFTMDDTVFYMIRDVRLCYV